MPLLYAAIADRNKVIAEHPAGQQPKLAEVCGKIVAQVPLNENGKTTFEETNHKYHYKSVGERVYICAADRDMQLRRCHGFLDAIHAKVSKDPSNLKGALKEQFEFYNNPANDKLESLNMEIQEVKEKMLDNITLVLDRGEKLDAMADKSSQLAENAHSFQRTSTALKRAYCQKHAKMIILVVVLVLVLIGILLAILIPVFSSKN